MPCRISTWGDYSSLSNPDYTQLETDEDERYSPRAVYQRLLGMLIAANTTLNDMEEFGRLYLPGFFEADILQLQSYRCDWISYMAKQITTTTDTCKECREHGRKVIRERRRLYT